MERSLTALKNTLKESGKSITVPRSRVFEVLQDGGPLSVAEIAKKCSPDIDKATVYRTIETYENLGIINRIWHGFKSTVELSEIFTPHHHHAVCQQCGAMIDIKSEKLERALSELSREYGFVSLSHSVELSGYCYKCH